jgi:hypothetical protein
MGSFGNTLQEIRQSIQATTPKGTPVELPADLVAELEEEFPELAGHIRTAIERAFKGMTGTAAPEKKADAKTETPADSKATDQATNDQLVRDAVVALQIEALEDAHPTWREIVGAVDSAGKYDPENPFRKWLATQPTDYQTKINSTNSAMVIGRAIDTFLAHQAEQAKKTTPATPVPHAQARKDRIAAAVQPRGAGGNPTPSKSADDEFNEGYREG